MSKKLDHLFGRVVEINFTPEVTLDRDELADRLAVAFKSLSVKHKPHRIAMAKWIITLLEEEMEDYLTKIEKGNFHDRKVEGPSPSQRRKQDGNIHTQLIGGRIVYSQDKRKNG